MAIDISAFKDVLTEFMEEGKVKERVLHSDLQEFDYPKFHQYGLKAYFMRDTVWSVDGITYNFGGASAYTAPMFTIKDDTMTINNADAMHATKAEFRASKAVLQIDGLAIWRPEWDPTIRL